MFLNFRTMAKTSNKPAPEMGSAQIEEMEVVGQATEVEASKEAEENKEVKGNKKPEKEISTDVLALMKLYPQYEEFYVTPNGFVHPSGVPEYLRKDATLYKNKFSNK